MKYSHQPSFLPHVHGLTERYFIFLDVWQKSKLSVEIVRTRCSGLRYCMYHKKCSLWLAGSVFMHARLRLRFKP